MVLTFESNKTWVCDLHYFKSPEKTIVRKNHRKRKSFRKLYLNSHQHTVKNHQFSNVFKQSWFCITDLFFITFFVIIQNQASQVFQFFWLFSSISIEFRHFADILVMVIFSPIYWWLQYVTLIFGAK